MKKENDTLVYLGIGAAALWYFWPQISALIPNGAAATENPSIQAAQDAASAVAAQGGTPLQQAQAAQQASYGTGVTVGTDGNVYVNGQLYTNASGQPVKAGTPVAPPAASAPSPAPQQVTVQLAPADSVTLNTANPAEAGIAALATQSTSAANLNSKLATTPGFINLSISPTGVLQANGLIDPTTGAVIQGSAPPGIGVAPKIAGLRKSSRSQWRRAA